MALPTANTLYGAVLKLGGTAVEDGTVEMTLTLARDIASVDTFGGKVSAVGPLGGSGSIKAIYDETAGSPHKLLEAEVLNPTEGGIAVIFQPKGTASGNDEYSFNIVVGQADLGGSANDIQQSSYSFETTGAITVSAQV